MRIGTILLAVILNINSLFAQDTLSGNYNSLKINAGTHIISSVVNVKGLLEILPNAKIEFQQNGVLVCESGIICIGSKNNIEFYGKLNNEGVGIIIKNVDSSSIEIVGSIFRNLQFPLFFDFGWKRKLVNIHDCYFLNNVGKTSLIQVLDPPFNLNSDSLFTEFNLKNNIFNNNNASLYFEDLKSDQIKYDISNNVFVGNTVYGFKNYNISTNILYGRVDQVFTKYLPKIENNSFVFNYLIDNLTDTIVHQANFGIYGTEKEVSLQKNFFGSNKKEFISSSIYDQALNYNAPKVIYEPYLEAPSSDIPGHIYSIFTLDKNNFTDSVAINQSLKGFIVKSNTNLDYTKSKLRLTYFIDDTSLRHIDTLIAFDQKPNGDENQLTFNRNLYNQNRVGFLSLFDVSDLQGNLVPTLKLGWGKYLIDHRRRKIILDSLNLIRAKDSLQKPPSPLDSIKNTFQKIEAPLKSRLEFGLLAGGSIYTGTISQSNLFKNDVNLYFGANVNYTIFSNLSGSLTLSKFTVSNTDKNSNNSDQLARGMSFSTSMLGISASSNYDFVDNRLYTKARKFRPSIGLGLDVFSFSPSDVYNGVKYKLQPLGTGGQFTDSTRKPYSLLTIGYFLNVKLKYQLNRFNSVGLHISFHKSMSDYLDDVGPDFYPSPEKILKSKIENKDAALFFSNPTSRNVIGQYRNSPNDQKDGFILFGVYYSRRLFN